MEMLRRLYERLDTYPQSFTAEHGRDFLDAYPDYPVYSTILYLLAVFYLPGYLERHHIRVSMKYVVAGWNLFLSLASIYGSYYTGGYAWELIPLRTFHNNFCEMIAVEGGKDVVSTQANLVHAQQRALLGKVPVVDKWERCGPVESAIVTSLYDGAGAFSVAMFGYLKTPELLDTVFLILQDKPVSFLHWYHHLVTAAYVWMTAYRPIPSGICFCAMNYFVHSIMYFYYFLVVMGLRKSIRPFAPVITLLQVSQMFIGMYLTVYTYFQYWLGPQFYGTWFFVLGEYILTRWHHLTFQYATYRATGAFAKEVPVYDMSDHFWGCDSDPTNMRVCMMMYGSYCVLFAVLFKELYLDKRAHKNSLVLARKERKAAQETEKATEDSSAAAAKTAVEK